MTLWTYATRCSCNRIPYSVLPSVAQAHDLRHRAALHFGGLMSMHRFRTAAIIGNAFIALTLSACVDEKIIFRDRELFAPVQTAAGGFVGYSDSTAKLTVCGNCHIGQQDGRDETAHSHEIGRARVCTPVTV